MTTLSRILFLGILVQLVLAQSFATAGGISSNGGDGVASDFFSIANSLAQNLSKQQGRPPLNIPLFINILKKVRIYSKPRLVLDGHEVGAINTPARLEIVVSQLYWKGLYSTPKLKYVLVLHEFLGLMGYDDLRFTISNQILNGPGIQVSSVACPFVSGFANLKGASSYTLELFQFIVGNVYDYRVQVYRSGMPDPDSEAIASQITNWQNNGSKPVMIIGEGGTAILQKAESLMNGWLINFEVWPGPQYFGKSTWIRGSEKFETSFKCVGRFR